MTITTPANITIGGPSLPQERRLVTAIPGPESQARMARKTAAVASGVSTMMPVFAVAAGGGVVVDADGNSLIDLGSGIAVTNVGNADPFVTEAVIEQVRRFTHTCFTITPYDAPADLPPLTEQAKRKILGENLARLHGIDVEAKKAELGVA